MPLPKEELVEFLRDVRDILELNSEAVLEKVTEVYLRKNMDSRKKA